MEDMRIDPPRRSRFEEDADLGTEFLLNVIGGFMGIFELIFLLPFALIGVVVRGLRRLLWRT